MQVCNFSRLDIDNVVIVLVFHWKKNGMIRLRQSLVGEVLTAGCMFDTQNLKS